ncbi:tRNA pseudouridine(54/55) synthase Pus10 [Thermococcus waiotapuensis]|uniref:tRNA pseudouridine synthase Pus10 n=1 Tax=Thermococcus waiotapuensis TaxID=90909 RepID=A0AAE4NWZ1_9EURY|nr:tRNA pseudouridine(54/55) synthase Pus10 [Thermococcus waiotapuensis]MDV3104749.1 tRNA pseudouridine(54/55) synthase Pus10 [Thermococcus waiotapuensis]
MIIEKASKALEKHELCNHCLGRLFAKLGKGTNEERGRAIRFVLNMERSREGLFLIGEPEECGLCGNVFERIPELVEKMKKASEGIEFDTFLVGSRFPEEVRRKEKVLWEEFGIETGEPINREFNRELGKAFGVETGKDTSRNPDVLFIVEPYLGEIEVQINPIYIYGRYRKLVRGIPQTPLPEFKESIASIICRVVARAFDGECIFKGAGREDVDVRTLGNGRPFVVEVKRPKRRKVDLNKIAEEINASGKVEVLDLGFVSANEAEEVLTKNHRKEYLALVFVKDGVTPEEAVEVARKLRNLEIHQRTPWRVRKVRTDKVRVKKVYEAQSRWIDDTHFELYLVTDGGLYIKELISGDKGRTKPSVSDLLGKSAWCERLDVLNILDD